jgi:hypothetical protein
MTDWATISALATAGGTLVLALATFASVRSANRAARTAERALQIGLRPLLMPSRLEDPAEKMMWVDQHWAKVPGGRGFVEVVDDRIYLAMALRNAGNGIGVIHGWHPITEWPATLEHAAPDTFRPMTRDLYIPASGSGFWQAAIRDTSDDAYDALHELIDGRRVFSIELLYGDHEGGQRAISRFSLAPVPEGPHWLCSVTKHWSLDRPDPR